MSTGKKKVQFSDKKKLNKYERDDSESGGELSDDDESGKKKAKHSLDSDEEDNTDKYDILNKEVLNDIGQENKTAEFEGDIKLTPFNMKDELDEGDFDKEGYYHWKKDKDVVKDAWLDNIDWGNVNTFSKKSYELNSKDGEKENEERSDEDDDINNEEEEDLEPDNESTQVDTFKKIIPFLKPNETILNAIKRLGKSNRSSSAVSSLSASQRWLKKKNQASEDSKMETGESSDRSGDKESLEKLTGFANYFIDQGFYDIYEETPESLLKKVDNFEKRNCRKDTSVALAASSFDIFADEVDETELKKSANADSADKETLEDSVVKWLYKLTNTDDAKVNGPFTSLQMLEMADKGELSEAGVWCRKVNDVSGTFYNSKRIDFDLYT